MSYCEFCSNMSNKCACSIDLTEPRLEAELAVADNIMAAENPHIENSVSLLKEIENIEDYKTPKPINIIDETLYIPKLERKTNKPEELCIREQDLNEVSMELFSEEELIPDANFEDYIIHVNECDTCREFVCICDTIIRCPMLGCDNNEYYYYFSSYGMCFDCYMVKRKQEICDTLIKWCPMSGCNNKYNFNYSHPSYEMCFDCEMKERKQELIDELLYPDDIPMELRYNSDRDSF